MDYEPMEMISFKLPMRHIYDLDDLAKKHRISRSKLLRIMVKLFLEDPEAKRKLATLLNSVIR